MGPEDLYKLRIAGDPRLSPDGRTVAYVLTTLDRDSNEYRSSIWIAPVDGSETPRQLTAGTKRDAAPRWSPDGGRLAFVSNRDTDRLQLHVIDIAGGEARRVTDLKADVEEPAWSPDGTRVGFASRVPDPAYDEEDEKRRRPRRFTRLHYKLDNVGWTGDRRKHLFVGDLQGGVTQLTDGDFEHSSLAWSPDGDRISFASARHDDWDINPVSDIYVAAASGGDPERVTSMDGSCARPSWSPDGTRIAYEYSPGKWDEPRHTRIAVVDVSSGKRVVLTESLDRNCSPFPPMREPVWMGDRVIFAVEDGGNTHLCMAPADGTGEPGTVVAGEFRVTGYDSAAGNGVHVATTHTTLPELFFGDRQLTRLTEEFGAPLLPAERFTAGDSVDAWIMRPAGFEDGKRYPVLLTIHGGPFTQYGTGFFDEVQVYADAGYVVLFSNPRGSSGYSEEWGRAIRGTSGGIGPGWGTLDFEDIMAVVDTALERFDFIDVGRLGVMGGSYGGFMTTWITGHTNRFRAALSERAVNSWVSQWGSSDIGPFFKGYIGAHLYEDPDAWLRMSPATYAADIRTPLLILHSEEDLRCPVEQAEHLFATLRLLRREVELVRFPAESHELTRSGNPAHRVMRFEVVLDWFARHLKP